MNRKIIILLAAIAVTFVATRMHVNYKSWEPYSLSQYLRVPNTTSESKLAADNYLKTILGNQEFHQTMKSLEELVKTPVWTFTGEDPALYMIGGQLNNPNGNLWNWTIPAGNIMNITREASSKIEEAWQSGNKALAEEYLTTVSLVACRLLAGNPTLTQNMIGIAIGEQVATTAQNCPGITANNKVSNALTQLMDLATAEPGIRWEIEVAPILWGTIPLEDFPKTKVWGFELPTWVFRVSANRDSYERSWRKITQAVGEKQYIRELRKAQRDAWIELTPLNAKMLSFSIPIMSNDPGKELKAKLSKLTNPPINGSQSHQNLLLISHR